jgi:hypothetical protein
MAEKSRELRESMSEFFEIMKVALLMGGVK